MVEYIERELAIQATCNICPLLHECIGDDCANRNVIRSIPAADVVEVPHGEWNVTENRQHLDVECSICKSSFYVYKQGQYRIDRSNYCPNCGAKMDGKGE